MLNDRSHPAECFHVGEYIADEMKARGWSSADVAIRMGETDPKELAVDQLTVDMTIAVQDINALLTREFAEKLGRAFGVSPELFVNLDNAWRQWMWRSKKVTA